MNEIKIGRMLRAGMSGFVVGCQVDKIDVPSFGSLVRAPIGEDAQVYGLVHDLHVDDDGLVRHLATAPEVEPSTIQDAQVNRNIPVEISVLSVGYEEDSKLRHVLPPRPPLSLDLIYKCSPPEVMNFTSQGRFGYFRHLLRHEDIPLVELLAAHIRQSHQIHEKSGDPSWSKRAVEELILLLQDDYQTLTSLLGALQDTLGEERIV